MLTSATSLLDFYRLVYIPSALAGPSHHESRKTYESQLVALERLSRDWLAIARPERPADSPLRLADLSDDLVAAAMARLVEVGRSAGTANKLLRHVKAVWNLAHERELVPRACRARPYAELRREPQAWLPDEVTQLVQYALSLRGYVDLVPERIWWPAHLAFMLSTGCRIRVQMAVLVRHVDLERREVLLPAESQKQRRDQRRPLFASAIPLLRPLLATKQPDERLFGDWRYDRDCRYGVLRRRFYRLLVEAGLYASLDEIPKYVAGFHRMRRTTASQIAAARGLLAACDALGHSTPRVTERYYDRRYERPEPIEQLVNDPLAPAGVSAAHPNPPRPALALYCPTEAG